MPQLRALLFDFDGLIADTEPIHYEGFRRVAASRGITLTEEAYYERYVGFDDRDGFAAILADHGKPSNNTAALEREKADIVATLMQKELRPMPGVREFIQQAAAADDLAIGICSGALRNEVQLGLEGLGLSAYFNYIVAADDVAHSKPDPEGYRTLIRHLSAAAGTPPLSPAECVVLEDTLTGIQSGRAAGCFVVGVAGTETTETLAAKADMAVPSLEKLNLSDLRSAIARMIHQDA